MKIAPALAFAGINLFAPFVNAAEPVPDTKTCLPVSDMQTRLADNNYSAVYMFEHPDTKAGSEDYSFLYAQKGTGNWIKIDIQNQVNLCIDIKGTDLKYLSANAIPVQYKEPEISPAEAICMTRLTGIVMNSVINGETSIFKGVTEQGSLIYIFEDKVSRNTSTLYELFPIENITCLEAAPSTLYSSPIKSGLVEAFGYFNGERSLMDDLLPGEITPFFTEPTRELDSLHPSIV